MTRRTSLLPGLLALAVAAGACSTGASPATDLQDDVRADVYVKPDLPAEAVLEIVFGDHNTADRQDTVDDVPDTTAECPDGCTPDDGPDVLPGDVPTDEAAGDVEPADADALDAAEAVDIPPGTLGWPCLTADDCISGFCIDTMWGLQCTDICQGGSTCPQGWTCDPVGISEPTYICKDPFASLCMPCTVDKDCKDADPTSKKKNLCIDTGANGRFCGVECTTGSCPDGFTCLDIGVGTYVVKQCRPKDGQPCPCTDKYKEGAYTTPCYVENTWGKCVGQRTCDLACDAKTPAEEVCNGADDNCDGLADNNVVQKPCPLTNNFGTCIGTTVCINATEVCQGTYASQEVCNGVDDNCNGLTDELSADIDGDGIADCVDCDIDGDGIANTNPGCPTPTKLDNCPTVYNPDQADINHNGIGDACDCDIDGDGKPNNNPGCPIVLNPDNCPYVANPDQKDTDGNGQGDACSCDIDGDGVGNEGFDKLGAACKSCGKACDNCPTVPNPDQSDVNKNGLGDACDCDADDDGIANNAPGCPVVATPDNCPIVANADQKDTDADGKGDACDCDVDGDGVADNNPFCPLVAKPDNCRLAQNAKQEDTDGDGKGDACDCDIDGDGIPNNGVDATGAACPACGGLGQPLCDNCAYVANPDQKNTTGTAYGDACNTDYDGDGIPNADDNCPFAPNKDQRDQNGNGIGDACDCDADGDGVPNKGPTQQGGQCPACGGVGQPACDNCPFTPNAGQLDLDGDGQGDACDCDVDGDGDPNAGPNPSGGTCPDCGTACDCAPMDAAVHHGAKEKCNGIDDNCNGLVDGADLAEIVGGLFVGDQPPCANQRGVCAGARKPVTLCVAGKWGECGYTEFAAWAGAAFNAGGETLCDGLDNDCDGATDEDPVLTQPDGSKITGIGKPCGLGACAGGVTKCGTDQALMCPTYAAAVGEMCNGIDDDCDGLVDNQDLASQVNGFFPNDQPSCEKHVGVCKGIKKPATLCVDGLWVPCTEDIYSGWSPLYEGTSEKTCDNLDNDCDGQTDEDFSLVLLDGSMVFGAGQPCGVGRCANGRTTCRPDAKAIECLSELKATDEKCNGVDDDCNGLTDADDGAAVQGGRLLHDQPSCENQKGVCQGSVKLANLCVAGHWAACTDATYVAYTTKYEAGAERTCDGADNNCDGSVDEALGSTTCGLGECRHTVVNCVGGQPQFCDAAQGAIPEICDGKDNDCDGVTDNGFGFLTCGVGACKHTIPACVGGVLQKCDATEAMKGASPEVCDGIDNDCDGLTDNDDLASQVNGFFPNDSPLCDNQKGVCAGAKRKAVHCVAGAWQACNDSDYAYSSAYYAAGAEGVARCDGRDNNCDGQVDEGISQPCWTGTAETRNMGICHDGTSTCVAGAWGACAGQQSPQLEKCNLLDDDCDGLTDAADLSSISTDGYFPADHPLCANQVGVCSGATVKAVHCVAGAWQACTTPDYAANATANGTAYETGTETICDLLDNNCNGQVDENVTAHCYTGPNGTEGVGVCKGGLKTCVGGNLGPCVGQVTPTAEICDGLDNNCNGTTDADDYASPSTSYFPTEKPSCSKQAGVCQGAQKPVNLCVGGAWAACSDTTYAAYATLSGKTYQASESLCDGQDNDCNGVADLGLTQGCFTGPANQRHVGACKDGVQTCTAASWGACTGEVKATAETCNNIDDDCNGLTDDMSARTCYDGLPSTTRGIGSCKDGSQYCAAGIWGTCIGEVVPRPENCNNLDDDCNGFTDDGVTNSCYTGAIETRKVGECHDGSGSCINGAWVSCTGQQLPVTELCNNKDDDCDGVTDGNTQSCYTGTPASSQNKGNCKAGLQTCTAGTWGAACVGQIVPVPEICNNQDDDCNGLIDDGVTQPCYTGPANTRHVGRCTDGVSTCASGVWGTCVGEVKPNPELCNNLDDDCDGVTDNGLAVACYTGPSNTKNVGACHDGTSTCAAGVWGSCLNQQLPVAETCNDIDDDCNGPIDDAVTQPCYTGPAATRGKGLCHDGVATCSLGAWGTCIGQQLPTTELCDNLDQDCDGLTDNGVTLACYTYSHGRNQGLCHDGVLTCIAGVWGATCSGQQGPVAETCNNLDDDCDGIIDNGVTQTCYSGAAGTAGVGPCKAGTATCAAGAWGTCVGQVVPTPEVCDNIDNDCNGTIDNGVTRPCYTGPDGTLNLGICRTGMATCSFGFWGGCAGQVVPALEVCNGLDDNCNDSTDETPSCSAKCPTRINMTLSCGTGGSCVYTCNAGWLDCDGIAANGCEFLSGQHCYYPTLGDGIPGPLGTLVCTGSTPTCSVP